MHERISLDRQSGNFTGPISSNLGHTSRLAAASSGEHLVAVPWLWPLGPLGPDRTNYLSTGRARERESIGRGRERERE